MGDEIDDEEDLVPECPREGESGIDSGSEGSSGYTPTLPPTDREPLDELDEYVVGMVGKANQREKLGLFVEFCCGDDSSCCRVVQHLGIPYLGVTEQSLNIEDPSQFEQLVLWLQDVKFNVIVARFIFGVRFLAQSGLRGNEWQSTSLVENTPSVWQPKGATL